MSKFPNFILAVGALAALTGCDFHFGASGGWPAGDLSAATNFSQTASIPSDLSNLEVDNANGSVRVTGVAGGAPGWTWKLAVRARSDDAARRIASAVNCKTELADGRLKLVVTVPAMAEPHSIQSDFEITVPKSASILSKTSFGRTDLLGIGGNVDATDQNGEMDIRNIAGTVRARTSFATLALSATGAATVKNQNGAIDATHIGGALEAETSFAPMLAQDVLGPAVLANQNGEIKANAIHGPLTAKTSFAAINVYDIGGLVRLRDQNGSVEAVRVKGGADIKTSFDGLSVEEIGGDAVLANQNGGIFANAVTGAVKAATSFAAIEIKGAGTEFVCHNQNGAIRLRVTSAALARIEAETSFDILEVHLPAKAGPAIVAQTTFGKVESDFPLLPPRDGTDVFADTAPGVPRATLHNQNGNIRVYRD
jgi:hypothetical protein